MKKLLLFITIAIAFTCCKFRNESNEPVVNSISMDTLQDPVPMKEDPVVPTKPGVDSHSQPVETRPSNPQVNVKDTGRINNRIHPIPPPINDTISIQ